MGEAGDMGDDVARYEDPAPVAVATSVSSHSPTEGKTESMQSLNQSVGVADIDMGADAADCANTGPVAVASRGPSTLAEVATDAEIVEADRFETERALRGGRFRQHYRMY